MTDVERDFLRNIPLMRMRAKSDLEGYRFLIETTGRTYNQEIDRLLDRIHWLDEIEKELKKRN
jgi:hypothetical protein